jgi:predicted unusual protein kinase regulating ubiquinone biosynthesis (AarF/ABC1/UbiB family)
VDPTPIASASIGQVHVGTLHGKKVAVKLRRVDVLKDLQWSSAILGSCVGLLKTLRAPDAEEAGHLLTDLLGTFVRETNFLEEARTMNSFPDAPGVVIPRPHMNLCTDEIIVMDFVESVPLETFAKTLNESQRRRLATTLMQTFMQQLMESNVVHADPHPGNYGFDARGNIVLYDFGNVVAVDPDFQYSLKLFTLAMISRNVKEAARLLEDEMHLKVTDPKHLEDWLQAYFEYVRTPGLNALESFSKIQNVKKQPVIFTPDLVRLSRAFSSLEGACTRISPGFNYYQLVETFADSVILNQDFMERKASEDFRKLLERFNS